MGNRGSTFCHTVGQIAAAAPDGIAIMLPRGRNLSFKELLRLREEAAACLQSSGVVPCDVVPVVLQNELELVVALLGVMRCGARAFPVACGCTQEYYQTCARIHPPKLLVLGKTDVSTLKAPAAAFPGVACWVASITYPAYSAQMPYFELELSSHSAAPAVGAPAPADISMVSGKGKDVALLLPSDAPGGADDGGHPATTEMTHDELARSLADLDLAHQLVVKFPLFQKCDLLVRLFRSIASIQQEEHTRRATDFAFDLIKTAAQLSLAFSIFLMAFRGSHTNKPAPDHPATLSPSSTKPPLDQFTITLFISSLSFVNSLAGLVFYPSLKQSSVYFGYLSLSALLSAFAMMVLSQVPGRYRITAAAVTPAFPLLLMLLLLPVPWHRLPCARAAVAAVPGGASRAKALASSCWTHLTWWLSSGRVQSLRTDSNGRSAAWEKC